MSHVARWAIACSSLLFAATSLVARTANANGRFPNAQQVREPVPGTIIVAGTYGLLVSGNAGKDFGYVCESQLFGKTTMGSWVDPLLEALPNGTLVTGSQSIARTTTDFGCSFSSNYSLPFEHAVWPPPTMSAGNGIVIDVCPSYQAGGGILALASKQTGEAVTEHQLYKSSDGSQWAAVGKPIPASMMNLALTLDAAPSRPQRIYLSGTTRTGSVLVVTDDGGETWSPTTIPLDDEETVQGVYIGGVSPSDPERVYLRVQRLGLAPDGASSWDDSLVASSDGGKTFRDILRRQGSLMGFALSPDGSTVAVGFGDPMIDPHVTDHDALGIFGASASDLMFTKRISLPVSCLRWTSSALYVCARDDDPSGTMTTSPTFHLGVYRGAGLPANVADVTPLLKLKDVHGPLPWADKRVSACAGEWIEGDPTDPMSGSVCAAFVACSDGGTTAPGTDALVCGASATGGSGGAATGGGAGGSSGGRGGSASGGGGHGGAGGSGSASGAGAGDSTPSSGCGCKLARRRDDAASAWGLALLAMAALIRRSRGERMASRKRPY